MNHIQSAVPKPVIVNGKAMIHTASPMGGHFMTNHTVTTDPKTGLVVSIKRNIKQGAKS